MKKNILIVLLICVLLLTGCGKSNNINNNSSDNNNSNATKNNISYDIEVMDDVIYIPDENGYEIVNEFNEFYGDSLELFISYVGSYKEITDLHYDCGKIRGPHTRYDETISSLNEFEKCYNSKVQSDNLVNNKNEEERNVDLSVAFGYTGEFGVETYLHFFPKDKSKLIEFTKKMIAEDIQRNVLATYYEDDYYHYSIYPIIYNNELIDIEIIKETVSIENKDRVKEFRDASLNINKPSHTDYGVKYAESNDNYGAGYFDFERMYGELYYYPLALLSFRDDAIDKGNTFEYKSIKRDYLSMMLDGKTSDEVMNEYNQYTKKYYGCEYCN